MRDRNIPYNVLSPKVERLTPADRDLYITRLSGKMLTEDEILAKLTAPESPSPREGGLNLRQAIAFFRPFQTQKQEGLAVGAKPAAGEVLAALEGEDAREAGISVPAARPILKAQLLKELPKLSGALFDSVLAWLKKEPVAVTAPKPQGQRALKSVVSKPSIFVRVSALHAFIIPLLMFTASILGLESRSTAQTVPTPAAQASMNIDFEKAVGRAMDLSSLTDKDWEEVSKRAEQTHEQLLIAANTQEHRQMIVRVLPKLEKLFPGFTRQLDMFNASILISPAYHGPAIPIHFPDHTVIVISQSEFDGKTRAEQGTPKRGALSPTKSPLSPFGLRPRCVRKNDP